MENVLDKCLTPTTEMIANLIEIENGFINKNHPDFVGSADSLLNLFQTEQEFTDNSQKTFGLMQSANKTPQGRKSRLESPQEIEVIEETKDEDKKGGMFDSITGYLGKNKPKKGEQEESKGE